MKNRPFIPAPKLTPPAPVGPGMAATTPAVPAVTAPRPAPVEVRADPSVPTTEVHFIQDGNVVAKIVNLIKPTAVVRLLDDRIELDNCEIELPEAKFIARANSAPGAPLEQVKKFTAAKATIMHGCLIVEERHLIAPLDGLIIRS